MSVSVQFRSPQPGQKISSSDRMLGFAYRTYKLLVSPVLHALTPTRCVYLPTCSEYAYTATHRFGVFRGSWLAFRRILRCHPWAEGGLDPVPASHDSDCKGRNHLP